MVPTNPQIILKIDQSESAPDVELISLGPIGSGNKLTGVRVWHRVPLFSNLEWFNFRLHGHEDSNSSSCAFVEISDAGKLIKFINSMTKMADSCGFGDLEPAATTEINFTIDENELKLKNDQMAVKFSLPVRWFDSKWAAATITFPPISVPRACVKLVSGVDQLAQILKRIDRWKDEWSVDVLSVAVFEADGQEDLWDIEFVAETSSPPHVRLLTVLPNCPEHQLSKSRGYKPTRVTINLSAATRALIGPLAENGRLTGSATAVSLAWIKDEAIICNVNWNAIEHGIFISTTIFIPSRL